MCQNFPCCGKRHYGACGTAQTPRPARKKKSKKPVMPKVSSKPGTGVLLTAEQSAWVGSGVSKPVFDEIMARLESLEARVNEFEKRKRYMRDYMREKRAEERGDG